jgi:phenylpropionate dioxygenase-like ring-hydroxylating dioxygenase large terminal subunit
MRSAYGLQIPELDTTLTSVGSGTPMGEVLRRYWHPVCRSEDLNDLPKRVRILGEDLVVFRDGTGRAGLLFFRCSHRGASLEYAKVELEGLRCCYHGWLYDVEGGIREMPCEPADSTFKSRLEHPAYPVEEFGGIVFAYMGPPDKKPHLPKYDVLQQGPGTLKAYHGPRIGGSTDCNWLQSQENLMDIAHTLWLHTRHSISQFPSDLYGIMPQFEYEETDLGLTATMIRRLPDARTWTVVWEMFMPFTSFVVYVSAPRVDIPGASIERSRRVGYCVPVDDTHQTFALIEWMPEGGEPLRGPSREQLAPAGRKDQSYEYTQRFPDDKEATEGLGPIANHRLEHLATSDRGVIMLRNLLRRAIRDVESGRDPKGIIRDPELAAHVRTTAGSSIDDPASDARSQQPEGVAL